MALSMGCLRLRNADQPKGRKVLFVAGQILHFFFIFCAIFGVFSRHFDNGGVQLVAYTVVNLYVYTLCLLNWPVKVYFKEYEITDDLRTSQSDLEGPEHAGEFDQL